MCGRILWPAQSFRLGPFRRFAVEQLEVSLGCFHGERSSLRCIAVLNAMALPALVLVLAHQW